MSEKTLTRADLTDSVHEHLGLSKTDSANLVEEVFKHITNSLCSGRNVKITTFGTFVLRKKHERVGRNPKTGEEVKISPRTVLSFRPSHILKNSINKSLISKNQLS